MTVRDFFVAAVSSVLALTVGHALGSLGPHTTLGRAKAKSEKAFLLSVGLKFSDRESADGLLDAWAAAAAWCLEHEPFLFAYEVAQSDQDPLTYTIIERYRSKADYLGPHRSSPAFKLFRPKMRALQDRGKVVVSGSSYHELGTGFT